jgi:hypothetical protein
MDFPVKRFWLGLLAGMLLPGAVAAQATFDPTRPPADLMNRAEGADVTPGESAQGGSGQIIILSPGRRQVTIGAETAKPGGRLGDRILVDANDSEIVMRNGAKVERSGLYGNVRKETVTPRAADSRRQPSTGAVVRK